MTELSRVIVAGLSNSFDFAATKSEIAFVVVKLAGHAIVESA